MAFQRVLRQYSNPYKDTVYITIRDLRTGGQQTIVSNRIHPFFVQRIGTDPNLHLAATNSEGHVYRGKIKGGAWIDADHLKRGDRLLQSDEEWSEVVSVSIVAEPLKAYNVTVETSETFYIRAGDAGIGADAVWVHNCPEFGLLPTDFARAAREYMDEIRTITGIGVKSEQRRLLAGALRDERYGRLSTEAYEAHRGNYNGQQLIAEWVRRTGQSWPRGAQIQHVIPQRNGGPHQWWNIHPATQGAQHQGGLHGTGSSLNRILGTYGR